MSKQFVANCVDNDVQIYIENSDTTIRKVYKKMMCEDRSVFDKNNKFLEDSDD